MRREREPLTRERLVDAAVVLLDEVGLDALSLRRLAADLGVSAPTLYWHVRDKRALLDLVAERIVGERHVEVGPVRGEAWWDWLARSARAQYRALVAHRDAPRVVAGNRPTAASLPTVETSLETLVVAGFPPAEAMDALFTVGHFVLGTALEYHAEAGRGDGPADLEVAAHLTEYPHLAAAVAHHRIPDPDATFERGLSVILAGLRARQAELLDRRPSSRRRRRPGALRGAVEYLDGDALDGTDPEIVDLMENGPLDPRDHPAGNG